MGSWGRRPGTCGRSSGARNWRKFAERRLGSENRFGFQANVFPQANLGSEKIAHEAAELLLSFYPGGPQEAKLRIMRLATNVRYFRKRLREMGFIVYGDDDSAVVPLLVCVPGKAQAIMEELFERNIACVAGIFPATSITTGRTRICISAAHTREMLDTVLSSISEVGDRLQLKYSL